ncbi:MAG: DUF2889 domain-containing protein [Rhodovibrionaceae bacterium]
MPLSPPAAREAIHKRTYDFNGYRREDGLWDIEGRIRDSKTYSFENDHRGSVEAGDAIHEMEVRLTLDDGFEVVAAEAATHHAPYGLCPAVTPNFAKLTGLKVGPGWRESVRRRVGGVEGCTHIVEMVFNMATVAYQTMVPILARERSSNRPGDVTGKKPALLNSCHVFASDGEVARESWPQFYTGDKPLPKTPQGKG